MTKAQPSADTRTYTVGPKGKSKRWNVYSNRPGRVPLVYSEHATEAAALKMAARRNAEVSSSDKIA